MLTLALRPREMIVIDTPEGEVLITPCPLPRAFHVSTCPNQTLHVTPVTEEEFRKGPGSRNWIVIDSSGGPIRVRRMFGRAAPSAARAARPPEAAASRDSNRPAPSGEPMLVNSHLAIDAPRSMQIFRRPMPPAGSPAGPPPAPAQGTQ